MARVEQDVVLGGRYWLLRRIATGGMGTVWEASDLLLRRRVAVKLLSEALGTDPVFVERFRREARAAAGLSHPNVARVFDFGDGGRSGDEGRPEGPFIVMELIPGRTLAAHLAERGRLDPTEAARIAADVALALQAAHSAGVVHRDVKPGNVMITPGGEVKVMDFGIAAAASEAPLTATGAALGTAAYIAPEQATGGHATPASDVYSLGCVLYQLLAGRPPFEGTPVAMAAAHARQEPAPVRSLAPNVPPWLAAACERALAKDPRDRPAPAAAFAAMLSPAEGTNGPSGLGPAAVGEPATAPVEAPAPTAVLEAAAPLQVPAATVLEPVPAASVSEPVPVPVPPAGTAIPARPPRPRRSVALALVGLILVLAALAALGAYLAVHTGREPARAKAPASPARTSSRPSPPAPRVVPDVVGLRLDQARSRLDALGIPVGAVRSAQGPRGEVVRVDPSRGSTLSSGQSVTLYVGAGQTGGRSTGHRHGRHHGKDGRKKH